MFNDAICYFIIHISAASMKRSLSNIIDSCLDECIVLVNHELCSRISDL